MRFIFGFLFPSSFGGLIGVLLLNRPLDILFYDPLFVAAYFYSVLSLGAVHFISAASSTYFHYFSAIIDFYFYSCWIVLNKKTSFSPFSALKIKTTSKNR